MFWEFFIEPTDGDSGTKVSKACVFLYAVIKSLSEFQVELECCGLPPVFPKTSRTGNLDAIRPVTIYYGGGWYGGGYYGGWHEAAPGTWLTSRASRINPNPLRGAGLRPLVLDYCNAVLRSSRGKPVALGILFVPT